MSVLDEKFRRHPLRYVLQCLLATAAVTTILALMDAVAHTALIASLGASAFIAFTMPEAHVSESRYLIGGYLVGIAVGAAFGLLYEWAEPVERGVSQVVARVGFAGIAVGVAIFVMAVTNTEHPPAAGIALGLVISGWDVWTLLVLFGAIASLAILRSLLRPFLRNLL